MAINLDGMTENLERIAIDPGTSFLGGQSTSLFTGSDVAIGRVPNPFLPATPMPDPGALAAEVVSMIVNDVTQFAASYLGMKIGELLTPPSVSDITGIAASYMGEYFMSPGDILKKLTQDVEEERDKTDEEEIKKALGEIKTHIDEKVGGIKKAISEVIDDKLPDWVKDIPTYITQGPKWVKAQAYMIDETCCYIIEKQINEQTSKLMEKKMDIVNGIALGLAKKTASKANEAVFEATYNKLKKVVELQAKAKNLAFSAIKAALFALKAALGI